MREIQQEPFAWPCFSHILEKNVKKRGKNLHVLYTVYIFAMISKMKYKT
jgi:hypothetical protein